MPSAWLPLLADLSLERNLLTALPPELACPPAPLALQHLDVGGNRLTELPGAGGTGCAGSDSSTAPAAPELQYLSLAGNDIRGSLPPAWPALYPALEMLLLFGNQLSGTVQPESWAGDAALPRLRYM